MGPYRKFMFSSGIITTVIFLVTKMSKLESDIQNFREMFLQNIMPRNRQTFQNESSKMKMVTEEKWHKDFNLLSVSPFIYMFGTTEVQVGGSVPTECSLLFIGILSGPDMADRRQGIRETYLRNVDSSKVVYRFILGNPTHDLVKEHAKHKDMVFINQRERYTGLDSVLPYKSATIFVIASRMTTKPPWLLKTDDDSLVNLPKVLEKLTDLEGGHYYGYCFQKAYPVRNKLSKWYIDELHWPDGKPYPPFCVGAGYFMSTKAFSCAAKRIQLPDHAYFPMEDVSGGMMMSTCNISASTISGIYSMRVSMTEFLIQHYVKTSSDIHKLWQKINGR